VNSLPHLLQTPASPSGVCFLRRLDDGRCAMDQETLVEVMFAIGSSAALAAVATFIMWFVL
jgi:hypothetical protein